MTGGRLKRVRHHVGEDDFCFTYGDGVSDVDIGALTAFHREQGTLVTLTATQPPGRFGALGVNVRTWITTHGFALNVGCDLAAYDGIIPCGIFDRGITSMERALSRPIDIKSVRAALARPAFPS